MLLEKHKNFNILKDGNRAVFFRDGRAFAEACLHTPILYMTTRPIGKVLFTDELFKALDLPLSTRTVFVEKLVSFIGS